MTSASLDAALSAAERRFIDANPQSRLRHERARPATEADVAGFTRATREFLIEHIDALRLP